MTTFYPLHDSSPALSGKKFEDMIEDDLKRMNIPYNKQVQHYTGGYTPKGSPASYKVDFELSDKNLECRNAGATGAPTKFPEALCRLSWLEKKTGKRGWLIYNGKAYDHYVKEDPVFKDMCEYFPEVTVMSHIDFLLYLHGLNNIQIGARLTKCRENLKKIMDRV